jgi:hypothetical protein
LSVQGYIPPTDWPTTWGHPACQAPVWPQALYGHILHYDGPKVMKLLVRWLCCSLCAGMLLRHIHEVGETLTPWFPIS